MASSFFFFLLLNVLICCVFDVKENTTRFFSFFSFFSRDWPWRLPSLVGASSSANIWPSSISRVYDSVSSAITSPPLHGNFVLAPRQCGSHSRGNEVTGHHLFECFISSFVRRLWLWRLLFLFLFLQNFRAGSTVFFSSFYPNAVFVFFSFLFFVVVVFYLIFLVFFFGGVCRNARKPKKKTKHLFPW